MWKQVFLRYSWYAWLLPWMCVLCTKIPIKCWRKNLLVSYVREKDKSTQVCLVLLPGFSTFLLIMAVGGGMWYGYHYQHIHMTRQALNILTIIHMAHQWQCLKMLSVLVICWAFINWTILGKSSTNHYKHGLNHHCSHWHAVFQITANIWQVWTWMTAKIKITDNCLCKGISTQRDANNLKHR